MRHFFRPATVIGFVILIKVFRDMGWIGKMNDRAEDQAIFLLSFTLLLGSAIYFSIDRPIGDE